MSQGAEQVDKRTYWEKDNPDYIETEREEGLDHGVPFIRLNGLERIHFRNPRFSETHGGDQIGEVPRGSLYFYDDSETSTAFSRIHAQPVSIRPDETTPTIHFQTVYPNKEINAYFRWEFETKGGNITRIDTNCAPQVWFAMIGVDHGFIRQQEEMAQNLGSLNYKKGILERFSWGANFVNLMGKTFPNPGEFTIVDLAPRYIPNSSGHTMNLISDTSADIVGPGGETVFLVDWAMKTGDLEVVQTHIDTGLRKRTRTRLQIKDYRAIDNALRGHEIDFQNQDRSVISRWIDMAAEVGCHMSFGGGGLDKLFED